jgi:arylsulfatase A-like enzyme
MKTPKRLLATAVLLALGGRGAPPTALAADALSRPNILWITCEDTGPQLGAYGDTYAETPHLDRLAGRGLRYRNAWSNAPVCAPARTTIISGVFPTATGSEHMRSLVRTPAFLRFYPQLLRERGYYCSNNSKEDYNLDPNGQVWDDSSQQAHWRNRPAGRPFFSIFNLTVTHESQIRARPHTLRHDPARVRVPAYHPDTPEVRHDWAQYYDNITTMDGQAGAILGEIEAAGLADDTVVVFYGDHGSGMPRSKRWPYDSGLHVPLIVHIPEKHRALAPPDYRPGAASDRLVSFVDLAPTLLSLIGEKPPAWLHGRAFLGTHVAPEPAALHGFRGRMDERIDLVRSARNRRYVYLRQYMPHLIYGQHLDYMFQTPTTRVWRELYDLGRLRPPQTSFWERKPPEELYDLESDPDEVRNLAGSSAHREILDELRTAVRSQALAVRDVGFLPEAEMHRRAGTSTIYDMAHDPARYPFERVFETADLASAMRAEDTPELRRRLGDGDAAVRYWAVLGLQMSGATAVNAETQRLRALLQDTAPNVRIAAAQALGELGGLDDLAAALATLRELVDPARNTIYVAGAALNAVDALGTKAATLHDTIRTMSQDDPRSPARAAGAYVERLVAHITGTAPDSGPPRSH